MGTVGSQGAKKALGGLGSPQSSGAGVWRKTAVLFIDGDNVGHSMPQQCNDNSLNLRGMHRVSVEQAHSFFGALKAPTEDESSGPQRVDFQEQHYHPLWLSKPHSKSTESESMF